MQKLEWVRVKFGKGISPNSGYRCKDYNEACGGADQSYHLLGRAADIPVRDAKDRHLLVRAALELRLTVIVYPTFIHIDNRAEPLLLLG